MDIQGLPYYDYIPNDSNPGRVEISLGGVGRNIGENLSRMGCPTKLITALGNDLYGQKIQKEAKLCDLDVTNSLILDDAATSNYLCILDENRDMVSAIAYMDIFDRLNVDFIKEKLPVIKNAKLCIIDTNIKLDVIEYILNNVKGVDFFLDTVSTQKALKVKDIIGKFHTIKPNKIEAEILSGIKIESDEDLDKAAAYFFSKGVKRVFISLGEEGLYYNDGSKSRKIKNPKIEVVSATGAGDAFVAALAYSYVHDFDIDYTARFAMATSIVALSSEHTINPNISVSNIIDKMEETNLC